MLKNRRSRVRDIGEVPALLMAWVVDGRVANALAAREEFQLAVVALHVEVEPGILRPHCFDLHAARNWHKRCRESSILVSRGQDFLIGSDERDVLVGRDRDVNAAREVEARFDVGRDVPEVTKRAVAAERLPQSVMRSTAVACNRS